MSIETLGIAIIVLLILCSAAWFVAKVLAQVAAPLKLIPWVVVAVIVSVWLLTNARALFHIHA